jgi:hypothetical protein
MEMEASEEVWVVVVHMDKVNNNVHRYARGGMHG